MNESGAKESIEHKTERKMPEMKTKMNMGTTVRKHVTKKVWNNMGIYWREGSFGRHTWRSLTVRQPVYSINCYRTFQISLISPLQWPQHAGRGDLMSIWPPTATAAPTTALHAASDSSSGIGFDSNCKHRSWHFTVITVPLFSSLNIHHINTLLITKPLWTLSTPITRKEFFLDILCKVVLNIRFYPSVTVAIICTISCKIQSLTVHSESDSGN